MKTQNISYPRRNLTNAVRAYFDVRWEPGVTAIDAFEAGREACAQTLEKKADAIRALPYDAFAADQLHPSVEPGSTGDKLPPKMD